MRTVWAQRREKLLSDCIVSPDVCHQTVDRLGEFVVPYQDALETETRQHHLHLYLQGLLSPLPRKNAEDVLGVPCNTTIRDLGAPLPTYQGRAGLSASLAKRRMIGVSWTMTVSFQVLKCVFSPSRFSTMTRERHRYGMKHPGAYVGGNSSRYQIRRMSTWRTIS